jgi:phosphorylase kinase alpha/beta subunit
MRLKNGLSLAAPGGGYEKVWIRDNVYVALGLESAGRHGAARRICWGLLDILHRHSWKLDWVLWQRPRSDYEFIHPRYTADGHEIHEPWGFKQHDAVGILLYHVGRLHRQGGHVLRTHADHHLLQKLVWYLARIEYWHDADSGMWEENVEVHASSLAACVRGLEELHGLVCLPDGLIERGRQSLARLLPAESQSKPYDMAQLSLLWPLELPRPEVLEPIERHLLRDYGVLRYENDPYHRHEREAEWTMGIPWLGLCWLHAGDRQRAARYLDWTDRIYHRARLPECYAGGQPCEHTPLAWSHAMALALRAQLA